MSLPTIEQVDAYEVPSMLIPRVAKEHNYTEEFASRLVKEAKRMLYVHAAVEPICPSHHVDMAWHEMLLFTRFYQEFCKFLGCEFIHHDPTPGPPDGGKMYQRTKDNYKKTFGEIDTECWP